MLGTPTNVSITVEYGYAVLRQEYRRTPDGLETWGWADHYNLDGTFKRATAKQHIGTLYGWRGKPPTGGA